MADKLLYDGDNLDILPRYLTDESAQEEPQLKDGLIALLLSRSS
jgi:hypothetical protein